MSLSVPHLILVLKGKKKENPIVTDWNLECLFGICKLFFDVGFFTAKPKKCIKHCIYHVKWLRMTSMAFDDDCTKTSYICSRPTQIE